MEITLNVSMNNIGQMHRQPVRDLAIEHRLNVIGWLNVYRGLMYLFNIDSFPENFAALYNW